MDSRTDDADFGSSDSLLLHYRRESGLDPPANSDVHRPSSGSDAGAPSDHPDVGALIVMHLPALRARARALCRGHVDSEDVVQDAIVRALRTKQPLRENSRARAWLLAIVYSTFADMRRRQRRCWTLTSEIEPADLPADEPTQPRPWHGIEDDDVRAAVTCLSDEMQTTYRMFAVEGRPYAEIAARMRVAQATVGSRIHRSRRKLRNLLAMQLRKTSQRTDARPAIATAK
jgi:RNA polymerase sigma-70 factor, ECF subfamily